MSAEANMTTVRTMMEVGFNQGRVAVVDELLAPGAVDHQEPDGTDFATHLKGVITMLRAAFPDLHFEIHHMLADEEIVAFHSTMTGTHLGPFRDLPPTGRTFAVRHMHFVKMRDGRGDDLWHLMDTPALMQQLTGPELTGPEPVAQRVNT